MRYLSVCSGIEAATQAFEPRGWEPVAFSEIEPFPSAVLAHHYPDVPNWGDMTKFKEWPDAAIDVLVGGTPCQDYSIAGQRLGMAGDRGQLTLTYVEIAARYRPSYIVWENVPGVLSSNSGRDFARFLGDLTGQRIDVPEGGWSNSGIIPGIADAYGCAYRVLDAQFVRTRRFPWAVPQRRRRVFVIGYLGDWRRAAAVLFDRESLSGNPPPRREAGQVAPTIPSRSLGGGGLGTDFDCDGGLIPSASMCLNAGAMGRIDGESETFIPEVAGTMKSCAQSGGFSNSADHASAGYMLPVAIQERAVCENPNAGPGGIGVSEDGASYTLEARTVSQAVAFDMRGREGGAMPEGPHDTANIRAASGGSSRSYVAQALIPTHDAVGTLCAEDSPHGARGLSGLQTMLSGYIQPQISPWAVRRLTPVECERLQAFPDNFTRIPYRGKTADKCPDGPRYKALGNSFAVNVVDWVGERIELVENINA